MRATFSSTRTSPADTGEARVVLGLEVFEGAHHRVVDVLRIAGGNTGLDFGRALVVVEGHLLLLVRHG
jgi:hypothetical protein